jgi:serine/threonine protein phosphatase 1
MSDSLLIFSDCHGSFRTLLTLVKKYGKGRQLISCGDEIDRGPRSMEVVKYMKENDIPSVASNHIDLALAFSTHTKLGYQAKCAEYYDRDVWLWNGGNETLDSWGCDRKKESRLPTDVLDWMSALPPYIIIDTPNADGRKLLISHTGYGFDADKDNWMRALWGRYPDNGEFTYEKGTGNPIDDNYFRCFGHTRNYVAQIGPHWVNIDSGCAYKGYGHLSALKWPECEIVSVENID